MAQEAKRGCGYRVVGALYLVGEYIPVDCDRLPYPLGACPVCGAGIKVGRGFTKINPLHLFGIHRGCIDQHHCRVCAPADQVAFIMRVGEKPYPTPQDFIKEGISLGVSKRISCIPRDLEVGKTAVYLSHKLACPVEEASESVAVAQAMDIVKNMIPISCIVVEDKHHPQPRLIEEPRVTYRFGIFCAFIPQRVELLVWEHDATPEKLAELGKRGITPVIIKDGDLDHARGVKP